MAVLCYSLQWIVRAQLPRSQFTGESLGRPAKKAFREAHALSRHCHPDYAQRDELSLTDKRCYVVPACVRAKDYNRI